MICYFRKNLKPSIKVEIEQQDRKSMSFEEMMQKAFNAEAKTGLRSSTMVRDSDAHYPRGYHLSHNTSSKVQTKGGRPRFLQKTFLVLDTKLKVILGMSFLKLSNADVSFGEEILTWKSYITIKVLPTTKRVQLINQQEFVIAALDINSKTFMVHLAIRKWEKIAMDPDRKAPIKTQIEVQSGAQCRAQKRVQVGALIFDEAPAKVLAKYLYYSNVFLMENVAELPENTEINEHAIKLEKGK